MLHDTPWLRNLSQMASGNPGADHIVPISEKSESWSHISFCAGVLVTYAVTFENASNVDRNQHCAYLIENYGNFGGRTRART
jgi:hypothetical protein